VLVVAVAVAAVLGSSATTWPFAVPSFIVVVKQRSVAPCHVWNTVELDSESLVPGVRSDPCEYKLLLYGCSVLLYMQECRKEEAIFAQTKRRGCMY
jgi:hypothetical protein